MVHRLRRRSPSAHASGDELADAGSGTGGDHRLLFSYSKSNSDVSGNLVRSASETRLETSWTIAIGEATSSGGVIITCESDIEEG